MSSDEYLTQPIGDDQQMPNFNYMKNAALIIITIQADMLDDPEVTFALTFGDGRHLLNSRYITPNFGFKVVVNTVDEDQLSDISSSLIEKFPILTTRQSIEATDLIHLGFDPYSEIARSIGGFKKRNGARATYLNGSDSLSVLLPDNIFTLKEELEKLYSASEAEQYKQVFPWLDSVSEIQDQADLDDLEQRLLESVLNGSNSEATISFKRFFDFRKYDEEIRIKSRTLRESWHIEDFPAKLANVADAQKIGLSFEDFYISVRRVDNGKSEQRELRQNFFAFIDLEDASTRFCTMDGRWYSFHTQFIDEIESRFDRLQEDANNPPSLDINVPHIIGEREDDYIEAFWKEANKKGSSCIILDKKNAQLKGMSKIEPCDLLTIDKCFIHAKRSNKSNMLSHLFNQGSHSALVFKQKVDFRKHLKDKSENKLEWLENLNVDEDIDPREYTICFMILKDKEDPDNSLSLPMFSKISFIKSVDSIRNLGFKWNLKMIPSFAADSQELGEAISQLDAETKGFQEDKSKVIAKKNAEKEKKNTAKQA